MKLFSGLKDVARDLQSVGFGFHVGSDSCGFMLDKSDPFPGWMLQRQLNCIGLSFLWFSLCVYPGCYRFALLVPHPSDWFETLNMVLTDLKSSRFCCLSGKVMC